MLYQSATFENRFAMHAITEIKENISYLVQHKVCFLLIVMLVFSTGIVSAQNKVYYIDNVAGKDSNAGTVLNAPWKTFDNVNRTTLSPGDKVLLKRNGVFQGSLVIHGSGTPGKPIKIASYGTGKRPVIDADGFEFAISSLNEEHLEINGIETAGGEKAGIYIGSTKDSSVLNHLRIINCYVHHVGNDSIYGWNCSTLTGGIVVANGAIINGQPEITAHAVINDVVIQGCTVRYIKRWTCISISSGHKGNTKGNANRISNCITEYSVADGIRMNGVQNSFIEYCTMYKNGGWPENPKGNWGGLGAWFFDADNCTIQFCEASYIDNPGRDGGAFDIDYWQTNSTVQYCYGHDCHGYGVSVFGADSTRPTVNAVVRYNIFSNNGRDSIHSNQGDFYIFTWNGGLLDGVKIYNNTSYWHPASNHAALIADADFTGTNQNIFVNNIIYSDSSRLVYTKNDRLNCDYNIYWSSTKKPVWANGEKEYYSLPEWQAATGNDKHSMYKNPMLQNIRFHGGKKIATAFMPAAHSPAIDAGIDIGNMENRDFAGRRTPVNGKREIGALETPYRKNHK